MNNKKDTTRGNYFNVKMFSLALTFKCILSADLSPNPVMHCGSSTKEFNHEEYPESLKLKNQIIQYNLAYNHLFFVRKEKFEMIHAILKEYDFKNLERFKPDGKIKGNICMYDKFIDQREFKIIYGLAQRFLFYKLENCPNDEHEAYRNLIFYFEGLVFFIHSVKAKQDNYILAYETLFEIISRINSSLRYDLGPDLSLLKDYRKKLSERLDAFVLSQKDLPDLQT